MTPGENIAVGESMSTRAPSSTTEPVPEPEQNDASKSTTCAKGAVMTDEAVNEVPSNHGGHQERSVNPQCAAVETAPNPPDNTGKRYLNIIENPNDAQPGFMDEETQTVSKDTFDNTPQITAGSVLNPHAMDISFLDEEYSITSSAEGKLDEIKDTATGYEAPDLGHQDPGAVSRTQEELQESSLSPFRSSHRRGLRDSKYASDPPSPSASKPLPRTHAQAHPNRNHYLAANTVSPGYRGNRRNRESYKDQVTRLEAELGQVRRDASAQADLARAQEEKFREIVTSSINSVYQMRMDLEKEKLAHHKKVTDVENHERQLRTREHLFKIGEDRIKQDLNKKTFAGYTIEDIEKAKRNGFFDGQASHKRNEATAKAKLAQMKMEQDKLEHLKRTWKDLARVELEATIRADIEEEITQRIGQQQYTLGYEQGKTVGRAEGYAEKVNVTHEEGYSKGYMASNRVHKLLYGLRNGTIPGNSPELEFLTDPDHPDNLFNRGMEIAKQEIASAQDVTSPTPAPASVPSPPSFETLPPASPRRRGYFDHDAVVNDEQPLINLEDY